MKQKCRSCDGKGAILDTTYDRSGEIMACTPCFATGLSREQIYKLLKPQRDAAARKRIASATTNR